MIIDLSTTQLLRKNIDRISILHLEILGSFSFLDSMSVDEEPQRITVSALAISVRAHDLLEIRGEPDLKEDLVALLVFDDDLEVRCLRVCFLGAFSLACWFIVAVLGHAGGGEWRLRDW